MEKIPLSKTHHALYIEGTQIAAVLTFTGCYS